VTLAVSGELGRRQFVDGVLLLPGLVVGLLMARWLAPVLDRGWTRPAVLVMSTAAALALVFDAVIG